MYSNLILLLILACYAEESTRTYCALPDAIYKDGVTAYAWGATGWNYNTAEQWKDNVVTCGGSNQSPINIVTGTATSETITPAINYINKSETIKYEENTTVGSTREYEGEFDSITALDASGQQYTYYTKQFHVHTPSEHTVDGNYFDMELHFVHFAVQTDQQSCNDIKNKLTVFALLFTKTEGTGDYDVFKPWTDSNLNEVSSFDLDIFFAAMKNNDKTYYHYSGSLTTVPCSQTVNWYVFTSPIPISPTQYATLRAQFADTTVFKNGGNNRPIQNTNARPITKGIGSWSGVAELADDLGEASFDLIKSVLAIASLLICMV